MERRRHNLSSTPEYQIWQKARYRCSNPNDKAYHNYGGRGITVCERWADDFMAFYLDMGPRPSPLHSLDRIDNDGPYSPENCRWATSRQQALNTRRTRHLTWRGETHSAIEWADLLGIPYGRIKDRLQRGWPVDRLLGSPPVPVGSPGCPRPRTKRPTSGLQ